MSCFYCQPVLPFYLLFHLALFLMYDVCLNMGNTGLIGLAGTTSYLLELCASLPATLFACILFQIYLLCFHRFWDSCGDLCSGKRLPTTAAMCTKFCMTGCALGRSTFVFGIVQGCPGRAYHTVCCCIFLLPGAAADERLLLCFQVVFLTKLSAPSHCIHDLPWAGALLEVCCAG